MRIAIVGSAYPFRGGLAAFNERLAREFMSLGHEVRLYTFTVQYPTWLFPGKTQLRSGPPPADLDIQRTLHSIEPLSWWRTGRQLQHWEPDLVIAKFWLPVMGLSLGSVLYLAPKTARRLAILDNVIPHERRPGDKAFTRYFIRAVDGAVAMTAAVAEEWKRLTQKPLRLLFHPIYDHYGPAVSKQEACDALGLNPAYRYLLFFGLIRAYKGLDLLLEAWLAQRLYRFTDVKILIAGELYEPYDKYRPLLESPRAKETVLFHEGFVPDEQVKYYFCAADAVIQPYRSATQSGVTQIAYYFEKPMIVTRVGGLSEMVTDGETGFCCEPDSESLAEAIERLLETPSERFVQGLRAGKAKYSWRTFAEQIVSFGKGI
ncbi:MAG: glycosyltransferase [Bacteroidia bacterium]|nr:glycosyltransferase [Bacteroidia bacterium]